MGGYIGIVFHDSLLRTSMLLCPICQRETLSRTTDHSGNVHCSVRRMTGSMPDTQKGGACATTSYVSVVIGLSLIMTSNDHLRGRRECGNLVVSPLPPQASLHQGC